MISVSDGQKIFTYESMEAFKKSVHFKPDGVFRNCRANDFRLIVKGDVPKGLDNIAFSKCGNWYFTMKDPEHGGAPNMRIVNYYLYDEPKAYPVVVVKRAGKVEVMVKDYFEKGDGRTFNKYLAKAPYKDFLSYNNLKHSRKKEKLETGYPKSSPVSATRKVIDLAGVKLELWTITLSEGESLPGRLQSRTFVDITKYKKGEEDKLVKDLDLVPAISAKIAKEILDSKEDL